MWKKEINSRKICFKKRKEKASLFLLGRLPPRPSPSFLSPAPPPGPRGPARPRQQRLQRAQLPPPAAVAWAPRVGPTAFFHLRPRRIGAQLTPRFPCAAPPIRAACAPRITVPLNSPQPPLANPPRNPSAIPSRKFTAPPPSSPNPRRRRRASPCLRRFAEVSPPSRSSRQAAHARALGEPSRAPHRRNGELPPAAMAPPSLPVALPRPRCSPRPARGPPWTAAQCPRGRSTMDRWTRSTAQPPPGPQHTAVDR